ncbi:uncharacterized protein LOC110450864 [Mizuhopecten yessoensis]|uniref:Complement C1q-like protein 2 n=1 Tax=Mizuhopecten yessoensis TaxID=6573 RepID=A0A210QN34_MIZYE|nr:uncharacterized protein LOC110450864 [Mizuhopecten yessoensis]OWF50143.1 Complement C1q-like protein 2 [Mizuhopecten yessoensis]
MTTMFVNLVLITCLTGSLGNMVEKELDPDIPPLLLHVLDPGSLPLSQRDPEPGTPPLQRRDLKHENPALKRQEVDHGNSPQEWQDLVTFVNEKIEGMERLLTEKDERIDQLELNVAIQKTEIKQLKWGLTSLEEEVSEKNEVVGKLVARVSALEGMVMSDAITSGRDTVRSQRTENESQTDLVKTSDSRPGSNAEKMLTSPPAVPKTSNYQNARTVLPRFEYLLNKSDDEEYVVNTDNGSEDLSIAKHSKFQQKRVTPKATIAFHVALSTSKVVTEDDVVVYDQETLDQGNGYNPREGLYITPESGTYVLTWTTLCNAHEAIQTVLVVNGAVKGVSWTDSNEINDYHQTTAVVVLTLNQGDRVFIRLGHADGHGAIVSNSAQYTGISTFSGWKLD